VAVARALVARPDIVFADEPTGNLDSRHGQTLLAFLRRTARDLGQTIVMVTHDPTAASYADQVVFLRDGLVVDEMVEPTPERVLGRMSRLDDAAQPVGV
jgi:putative ABC transport system ATP-binding protein